MTLLPTFSQDCNVAIIGSSGGIGAATLDLLAGDSRVAKISAFSRSPQPSAASNVSAGHIDINDEDSVAAAAAEAALNGPLDLIFVASGILWQGDDVRPEKSMRELSADNLAHLFRINAVGPALVAKHFLPKLHKRRKTLFASLSARVGSISDNRLGGWYSYRASKAALNMLLKTLSIEHARQWPDSIVAGLHPGTVDTGLSRPFTSRTPQHKLFTASTSANHLVTVMDRLTPEDTGGVFAWDGKRIEY